MSDIKDISEEKSVSWMEAKITLEGPDFSKDYVPAKRFGDYLIGIDETIRFFIENESKDFKLIPFEIPIRVSKGSIISEILKDLDVHLFRALAVYSAGKYVGPALETMAKNDFKELGFKT